MPTRREFLKGAAGVAVVVAFPAQALAPEPTVDATFFVQVTDEAAKDLLGGGLISPKQADRFIRRLCESPTLLRGDPIKVIVARDIPTCSMYFAGTWRVPEREWCAYKEANPFVDPTLGWDNEVIA